MQGSDRDDKLALYMEQLGSLEACTRGYEKKDFSKEFRRQPITAEVHCWNWLFSLGISLQLVASPGEFCTISSILLRWELFFNMVLILRMRILRGWPSRFYFELRPRTEIPLDSAIIKACQENDLSCARKLLSESRAHMNDVTSDNLTPLRVSHSFILLA